MNKSAIKSLSIGALVGGAMSAVILLIGTSGRTIVNPTEPMVIVPGLEYLGKSRISTVRHCEQQTGTNYRNLITDSELENMESCLSEHT